MAKTNREEESRRCRELYEKWSLLKRIVELYVEGVSWRGCKVITPNEPGRIPPAYSQIIDDEALKNGVRDMLVDGAGSFKLKVKGSEHLLEIRTQKEYALQDAEPGGRSFLWSATINAKVMESMYSLLETTQEPTRLAPVVENINFLEENMCSGLFVPRGLLQSDAAKADPTRTKWGPTVFGDKVSGLRRHIAFQIQSEVEPLISKAINYDGPIEVAWNENWPSRGEAWGPVYQVFKAQRIELKNLREDTLKAASLALQNHFISKRTHDEWIKWFS